MISRYAILTSIAAGFCCAVVASHVRAQTATFSSEADAISGTVQKCVLDELPIICTTTTIAPVDQSNTVTSGSNSTTAPDAAQTVYGVELYDLSTVDDSTSDSDTSSADDGTGEASTGQASLLQGLITWTTNHDLLSCSPDPSTPGQLDCMSTETTSGLKINGVAIPAGTYSAGASFAVSGPVQDPTCLLGQETFTGSLVAQVSTTQGIGTPQALIDLIGWHLTGQAVCTTAGLVNLFNTQYDLKVAGPSVAAGESNGDVRSFINEIGDEFINN